MLAIHKYVIVALLLYSCKCEVDDQYYPRYHLAPPSGWMNDPNGFCFFKGEYHLFYQYNPDSSQEPGIAHWGHAISKDLFTWEHLPIAMYPDQWYDKSGVFSGSAIVENDTMYLLYTGNLNHPDASLDHEQHQALAFSIDGESVSKYEENPVIDAPEYQPNIRDPKVWKNGDTFYMVLGNSFENETLGRALLYSSADLKSWDLVSILDKSNGSLGYMWECPDFFEIDGKFVLLFSPQGVKPQGDKYNNLYQTGYIVGNFDYDTYNFTPLTEFVELDHGHDFYATQTILDAFNRRLLVAWMDMWEQNYPERDDGWTGQMTIVRELSLSKDNHLIQKPVAEIILARGRLLYTARRTKGSKRIELTEKTGEIRIKSKASKDLNLFIESKNQSVKISYDHKQGLISLDRGGHDGLRRTGWKPIRKLKLKIYVDASSIEVFCGRGEVTFSSRFFPEDKVFVRLREDTEAEEMTVSSMRRTVEKPDSNN
ncbi:sucrose-6-phosphate hydrolase-like [Plodia interpunctella]|uniref:sucrose-6-phosphate hydrolase-like n=1 Tax=Plodia interpunctella TaxID=58824 RepID=UPI002367E46A|nr:sucrose-6-phosphate hydrolase-like [Plodia interpunctella]